MWQIEVHDLDQTEALGRRLGALLFPGAVVALIGPLGVGKTHLARAIAKGLEVPHGRIVTSPTFVLIQEYQGRLPIYHFDVYRLPDEGAFLDLGAEEYFSSQGVCLVEWADKVASCLPRERMQVRLAVTGENSRRLQFEAAGNFHQKVLMLLAASRSPLLAEK